MNSPVSAQRRIELLQYELEDLRGELETALKELEAARLEIRGFLAGRSIKEPYQLLRSYYEKQLDEQKRKSAAEMDGLKAKMKEREDYFKSKLMDADRLAAELRSELAMYKDQVNGSGKSERFHGDNLEPSSRSKDKESSDKGSKEDSDAPPQTAGKNPKKKPKERSPNCGGRRTPEGHPEETVVNELPEAGRRCGQCGKVYGKAAFTQEGSTVIEMQIIFRIVKHRQACYEPTCDCAGPGIIVAPRAARAMARSVYGDDFWLNMLIMKYAQQIPSNRSIEWLDMHGLKDVSSSTVCSGYGRMSTMMTPLDQLIIDHNRDATHWAADESGLKVFVEREEREGKHWAVWQIRSTDSVVYMLSSTQEAKEILAYFAETTNGDLLLSDRAQTFKTLNLWFVIAFCWAHMRRDFVRVGKYHKGNRCWAIAWLARIRNVYRLFGNRKKAPPDSAGFAELTEELKKAKKQIRTILDGELGQETLPSKRRKVLESLDRHWTGLWHFIEDVRLSMDNNEVEQGFRCLARHRNSAYGCHSEDYAHHLVRFLTIFETLKMNQIQALPYLRAYMKEYADNAGKIPTIEEWAPWNLSQRVQDLMAQQ